MVFHFSSEILYFLENVGVVFVRLIVRMAGMSMTESYLKIALFSVSNESVSAHFLYRRVTENVHLYFHTLFHYIIRNKAFIFFFFP
jgi:hypothetical protein